MGRCHVPRSTSIPVDVVRELRFGPLFLESVRMMVIPGLAGMHVQPVLEIILSCELRAVSYEQTVTLVCLKLAARGSKLVTGLREASVKEPGL